MTFHIITIFPESLEGYFGASVLGRAQKDKKIKIKFYNPRDFARDKHKVVDDRPFGGGPGMVMKVETIVRTVESILKKRSKNKKDKIKIILLAAGGKQFNEKMARNWAKKYKDIIFICGRYEGIDERVRTALKADSISVGPYIVTGGELPAAIIVDAISRYVPGVIGKDNALEDKRGVGVPTYTRPEVFEHGGKKYKAPKVLMTGHHKNIEQWRGERAK